MLLLFPFIFGCETGKPLETCVSIKSQVKLDMVREWNCYVYPAYCEHMDNNYTIKHNPN